jgi:hypothetical protein
MAVEIQREKRATHRPWTLVCMDSAKPHMSERNLAITEKFHLKSTANPPFNPDTVPSDFFLFEWLKGEFAFQSVDEISELFDIVEEILNPPTMETIASVLSNWIERLKRFIDIDDHYV